MVKKILISGVKEFSAGKTTVARALIRYFNDKSQSVSGFKPRSGNNIWYHWKLIRKGLKRGTVYSKDAKLMSREMNEKISINLLNPVHRLWTTTSETSTWNSLPNFLLDRITIDTQQYVLLNKQQDFPVKKKLFKKLFKQSKIIEIRTREDLQEYSGLYTNATAQAHKILSEKFDNLVLESYSNIAVPFEKISGLDYVLIAHPFKIEVYNGERYLQALELLSTLPVEQNTDHILESIKAIKTISVTPFESEIIKRTKMLLKPYLDEILE
ncbi:MAG: hypothetical protein R6U96_04445 [Promethearchaeia archaeon]